MTSGEFKWSKFKLGPFAKPFYVVAALFNAITFVAEVSPLFFPITAETFNFVSSSNLNRFLREHAGLIDFSSVYTTGYCDPGCSYHHRDLELVACPCG